MMTEVFQQSHNSPELNFLLNSIKTQVWYLKDPETYGKVNQAHADFLGLKIEEIEDKNISNFLD
ncbi:hypothetical protein [Halanaerobium congolense]|jgi:hypothetical protein|nr:hypothetical protein [Halanaerobium congolense]